MPLYFWIQYLDCVSLCIVYAGERFSRVERYYPTNCEHLYVVVLASCLLTGPATSSLLAQKLSNIRASYRIIVSSYCYNSSSLMVSCLACKKYI